MSEPVSQAVSVYLKTHSGQNKLFSVFKRELEKLLEREKILAMDPDVLNDRHITETFFKELSAFFRFVLITDHKDESLVLLKRKFCWDMQDILYLSKRDVNKPKNGLGKAETEYIEKLLVSESNFQLQRDILSLQ